MDHRRWKKSSFSNGNGQCVETAAHEREGVCVRNSRHPDGPVLHFTEQEWTAFVAGVKAGEFDAIV
ncbi:DUF397 domain-containing protein [Catenulispora subtropica]|uniref:DUF397 domain-containing protein n=1 Tax=Catenulispora subtropica TaxID=450798 RepID=A0ABP5BUF3_9ACTN